jgi:TRAP-type C4-dicarboxylate transport system substrate-binding protein
MKLSILSKTAIAAAGSLLSMASIQPANAEPVVLRVHHFLPSTSSAHVKLIQPWCDKVAKESAGDIKCEIYPAMQLGGTPAQLFDQVRDGVADIVWTVPTYTAGRFTKSEVFELPWMATNAKSGSQALWDYVEKNAQDEYKGVHRLFMHVHDGALFHFTKAQPKTLEDMVGLKIRAATRANSRMLEALGATPVQMPLPQVPEALAKGVVDGAAVPWEGTPAIKLSEIAKYHLNVADGMPRISNTIFLFGMNQTRYESLTPEQKKVIDANSGRETSAWAGEIGFDAVVAQYKKAAEDLEGTFYELPAGEYQRWVEATKPVEQGWINDVSAKGVDGKALIEEARALVRQYAQ